VKLVIKQKRSAIGRSRKQQDTIRALGIKRLNGEVSHEDTPQIRGMLTKVRHLVSVEERKE
jgi:large subunit ribosomal protein L30